MSAATVERATDTAIDAAPVDDNPQKIHHLVCPWCTPRATYDALPVGTPVRRWCGLVVTKKGDLSLPGTVVPPNACVMCAALEACVTCGAPRRPNGDIAHPVFGRRG